MESADLKDKRLNDRLREVLSQLGGHPTSSIPAACGGHAEMTGAYRLFDNEHATFESILEPHIESTRRRMGSQPVVLLAQDTSEMDITRPTRQVAGAGPLDGGARWGALLHLLHAFTPDGTPLGSVYAEAWARDPKGKGGHTCSRAERGAIPIEQKESYRWVEAFRYASEEAAHCSSTQMVCIADSEADIYELLAEAGTGAQPIDWIIRACQNRALQASDDGEATETYLREQVLAQPVLFTHTIHVRGRQPKIPSDTRVRRQPRDSRQADMEVRATRVTLRPPWRPDRKLPAVSVNTVLVCEADPPPNDEPVEWLLLTSMPVDTVDQVRRVIEYYSVRWMIEVFFRVLKSGCRVEERRFEHIDRFLSCLAVYLIVAWRTLYVCRLGRSCPDVSCESVFEPAEWKPVWKVVRRRDPPKRPPRLGDMVRMVAQLGGYVNHGKRAQPGPQTIWVGLQRMHDFALCWDLFGPETRAGP